MPVARGAVAVAVEAPLDARVPQIVVSDGRRAAITLARTGSMICRVAHARGITGTNGKTTTAGLIRHS